MIVVAALVLVIASAISLARAADGCAEAGGVVVVRALPPGYACVVEL